MPGLFYYPNGSELGAGQEITSLPWLLKGTCPSLVSCPLLLLPGTCRLGDSLRSPFPGWLLT